MTVCLINFHFAHNYGAVLQSLALKKKLELMDCKVSVIDYQPEYQMQLYKNNPNPIIFAKYTFLYNLHNNFVLCIYRTLRAFFITLFADRNRRKLLNLAFADFVNKNLNLTRCYSTQKELLAEPPIADIYISGSDQIWNPAVTFGVDPVYYLCFGNPLIRAIYAASPCKQLKFSVYGKIVKKYCSVLDFISLREEERKADFQSLLSREIVVCPDPTIFHDKNVYQNFEEPIPYENDSYILIYQFTQRDNSKLKSVVSKAYEKFNLCVVDISLVNYKWDVPVQKINAISPGAFLSFFKHAKYIITNSFHGTVFSVIYRKNFLTVEYNNTASRMYELLVNLGLQQNLFTNLTDFQFPLTNYENIESRLSDMKKAGHDYLTKVIMSAKQYD